MTHPTTRDPGPHARAAGRPLAFAAAALLIAIVASFSFATAQGAPQLPPFGVAEGMTAPDFTMLDLDGRPVTLSDLRGRPVLLNFWASWCPPCVAELPLLNQLAADRDDLLIVLLNVGEPHETVAPFLADLGVDAPTVLRDARANEHPLPSGVVPSRSVAQVYQTFGLPTTVVLDHRGVIQVRVSGPLNETNLPPVLARVGLER